MDFLGKNYYNDVYRRERELRDEEEAVGFLKQIGRMLFFIVLIYFTVRFLLGGWISFFLLLGLTALFAAMLVSPS